MTPNLDLRGDDRSRTPGNLRLLVLRGLMLLILLAIGGYPARAQQAGAQPWQLQPTWQLVVVPYLWTPWTDVSVHPSNTRLPSASGTVDFTTLADHLSWVPFMGQFEFRNGPFGFSGDYIHVAVRTGLTTRNILFGNGTTGTTIDTGTAMFYYRPFAQSNQYLDTGLGVRVWGVNTTLALNQAFLPAVSVSSGGSWADPLMALRYHRDFGNGFGATAYGDVGGFGLGAHIDWQVIGTVDYAWKSWIDLHAGFRSLNFSIGAPRAGIDVNMNGPLVSATIRF